MQQQESAATALAQRRKFLCISLRLPEKLWTEMVRSALPLTSKNFVSADLNGRYIASAQVSNEPEPSTNDVIENLFFEMNRQMEEESATPKDKKKAGKQTKTEKEKRRREEQKWKNKNSGTSGRK